jgi:hypothetical protein
MPTAAKCHKVLKLVLLLQPLTCLAADPWANILSSVNLPSNAVSVAPENVEDGAFVMLQGESKLATSLGFRALERQITVRNVIDLRAPKLAIIWEQPVRIPVFEIPKDARLFVKERWEGAPLMAGFRRGSGAVLWMATPPGPEGHERFPYLLQALQDLGLEPPLRSSRIWAFLDTAYRSRVDVDYFAARWRKAGIGALHISAWHFFEPDPQRDEYLKSLIEACHRRAILVYAWLELPHVSEAFWIQHPEWREKTASGADAQLDWRKLMNLANPDCSKAVTAGVRALIERFDWDGVNLAELYFESLEGHANPSRFTPLNADVRREFSAAHGFDPLELFTLESPRHLSKNAQGLRAFLDYRAELARRLQSQWIDQIDSVRQQRGWLDLVLTHVDDRIDPQTRDRIGADAAKLLPLLETRDFTFLVEDPATMWNQGPARYPRIAANYAPLTKRADRLAIDINIVERYQDVYPTKQQTGTELFQEVNLAARSFPRVALYFENSIFSTDLPLLPAAAAVATRFERLDGKVRIESPHGVGLAWKGAAQVNGRLWPAGDGTTLLLPAGPFEVEPAKAEPAVRLLDFNGELKTAAARPNGIEFSYDSRARALGMVSRSPKRVEIDGATAKVPVWRSSNGFVLPLPRGQHLVYVEAE